MPSTRSELVTARTYCRPLPDGQYETWEQVCDRVIRHQEWLWTRATGDHLSTEQAEELCELHQLMLERVALPAGRILWMGGTEQARKTEVSMFNCAFHVVRDVYSAVDAFYLLLNSCGVGFKPESGLLNGFPKPVEVQVNLNHRKAGKGNPENKELWYTEMGKSYYHLIVGDSGLAWAKALGKLLALKKPVDIVKLDFREIRPPGSLLAGYGWLSSGPYQIAEAFERVCSILNRKADMLLDEIDILDIINLVGTTLTSRRSAEIALLHAHHPLAEAFADAKRNHFERAPWRSQSNNSLVFWKRPTRLELRGLFQRMLDAGGSEPGLYNGEAALRRAPWFAGTNPCGEILLPDGGLCNLCEVDLTKVTPKNAERVFWLIARANYRQTCVYLKDDVLSDRWHETQEFLRLCGVGITGVVKWMDSLDNDPWEIEESLVDFREFARMGGR
jgi:adenosylcobalamin-dependent ribonucleoside-triphosphate reductase